MEQKYLITTLDKQSGDLNTYDIRTGEIVSSNGVPVVSGRFAYSLEIADAICNLVREGQTLTKISRMKGMPQLHVMYRWMDIHPDFKKLVEGAKANRAMYNLDKAQQILEDTDTTISRDELAAQKFKFDGHIKLAEKDNPKLMEGKGGAAPLQIVVNTGILREGATTVDIDGQAISIERGQRVSVDGLDGREGGESGSLPVEDAEESSSTDSADDATEYPDKY